MKKPDRSACLTGQRKLSSNHKNPAFYMQSQNVILIFCLKFKQVDNKSHHIMEYCLLILLSVGADMDPVSAEFIGPKIWAASESTGVK